MYFTVYILPIEFAIQLPVGKYENVPHSSYSSFLSQMELLVRTEVRHIINTNTQHHKDSNKHEDKQILHLYNFNPISNEITFNVKRIVIKSLANNTWETLSTWHYNNISSLPRLKRLPWSIVHLVVEQILTFILKYSNTGTNN